MCNEQPVAERSLAAAPVITIAIAQMITTIVVAVVVVVVVVAVVVIVVVVVVITTISATIVIRVGPPEARAHASALHSILHSMTWLY